MTAWPVNGIDLSRWNPVSLDESRMDGCEFVGIRACYGTAPDASYADHEALARRHGAVVLAYLFGRFGDGAAQARALVAAAPHADLYVLDRERDGTKPTMTLSQASACFATLHRLTAKKLLLYASEGNFPHSPLGQDANWVANYNPVPHPAMPWAIWQRTSAGGLDRDVFNGTLDQLRAMAGLTPPVADTAPLFKVVIDGDSRTKVTSVQAKPGGLKVGELYVATVTAERHDVAGVHWYRITVAHGDAAKYVGRWIAAHSWMTATPVGA